MRATGPLLLALALTALAAACSAGGGDADDGEERPVPAIHAVDPPLASAKTRVRIRGERLAGARVRVLFGDTEGEVLSASETEVWATGAAGTGSTDVVVVVNGVRSDAVVLALAPSGTQRPLEEQGLADPRGVTLDAGGGLLWIFDAQSGVIVYALPNGAYRVHRSPDSALAVPVAGAPLSETEILIADSAAKAIVSMDVDTTAVSPLVGGLATAPIALALDSAGNLYWTNGSGSIGRRTAAGVVDEAFALVPAAHGIAVASGSLWASDPNAGSIHRVELGTLAVTSGFATGIAGVRGLSREGAGVVACADAGALRVSESGAVTLAAPAHPLAGPASLSCENGSGTIYTLGGDGGLESSKSGEPWLLRAPVLASDGADAVWTDERLYVVSDARCENGGTGAIVEVVAPGSFRSKASGVCARDTIAARADAGITWVDRADGFARRLDLATGTVVVVGSNGAFAGALGSASNADGELFVVSATGSLDRYSLAGVFMEAIASSGAQPVFSDTLYWLQDGAIHAALFNHGDFLGTAQIAAGAGATDLAAVSGGGLLAGDGATVRRILPDGSATVIGTMAPGDRLGFTPFGEHHLTADGRPPVAVLP